jgi:hypothetical protein
MAYVPLAVAAGYLRQPEMELPLPGAGFARKIRVLLTAAANKPCAPRAVPARPGTRERQGQGSHQPVSQVLTADDSPAVSSPMGETATH